MRQRRGDDHIGAIEIDTAHNKAQHLSGQQIGVAMFGVNCVRQQMCGGRNHFVEINSLLLLCVPHVSQLKYKLSIQVITSISSPPSLFLGLLSLSLLSQDIGPRRSHCRRHHRLLRDVHRDLGRMDESTTKPAMGYNIMN